MTRRVCGIAIALLISLTVPVFGKNYSLHSPKLWTPEEKEIFDKANEPPEKEQEAAKKELEPIRIQNRQVKKAKVKVRKQKIAVKKEQLLVKDGVSYREVTVQKGDTLYGISLKYRKEGLSYSEILQFNGINEPDQLKVGDSIKIPVITERSSKQRNTLKPLNPVSAVAPQQTSAKPAVPPVNDSLLNDVKQSEVGKDEISAEKEQPVLPQPAEKAILVPPAPAQAPPVHAETASQRLRAFPNISTSGNNLFEQAVRSYRRDDCQTAIQLFGRFLAENKNSQLAADVSVFIADCYLKLSGK